MEILSALQHLWAWWDPRAIEHAISEGIFAPFLADDTMIADLLGAHAHWGSRHASFLLEIIERRGLHVATLAGILTAREQDVFACLRTTMTAEETARHLGMAYPTVKIHIGSISRKLGVSSLREAVASSARSRAR